jgi:alpha-L-fucosidase
MFKPRAASLKTHVIPEWYHDAKLGIFIHWGLYSVPGWAVPQKNLCGIPKSYVNSPYSEWYLNMLRIKGSPVWEHHRKTYGPDFSYDDFAPVFKKESERMDAAVWTRFIKKTGARYAVFTSKHHDGFALWPSMHKNPKKTGWNTDRNFVGELAMATREAGLRFGIYYSGILDWSFQKHAIVDIYDEILNGVSSPVYAAYCFNQFTELIDRYKPDILWNDIGYPLLGRVKKLLAYYYNTVPEGVTNNRWWTWCIPGNDRMYNLTKKILQGVLTSLPALNKSITSGNILNQIDLGDYASPEFEGNNEQVKFKWETTRGLCSSFGFNRNEDENCMLSGDELIRLFVDIISKNGNLLINIGPMADGTIPDNQQKPLLALGAWLEKNGDAVYGTRPWDRAGAVTETKTEVRFTSKSGEIFIFLLTRPSNPTVVIPDFPVKDGGSISLVEGSRVVPWKMDGKNLILNLPEDTGTSTVQVLRVKF